MFSKIAFALSAFAVFVAAVPAPNGSNHGDTIVAQCNTGAAQCCNTLQSATDPSVTSLLALLGISAGNIDGQVGLGCTAVAIIGVTQGANCAQQPVCCQKNNFNGLVNLGCSPISV